MAIKLGQKVKDKVTGLEGTAVARTEWLYGCGRITVQPGLDNDGKIPKFETFDELQLIVIDEKQVHVDDSKGDEPTGGPLPFTPERHETPER